VPRGSWSKRVRSGGVSLIGIGARDARGPARREGPHAGSRRRIRLGAGVPATRDLERTLYSTLAVVGAMTVAGTFLTHGTLSAVAFALVTAGLAVALTLLRAIATLMPPALRRTWRPLRVAVIGAAPAASDLRAELRRECVECVEVVGAIVPRPRAAGGREAADLGSLADIARLVQAHAIDLLLVGEHERRSVVVETVMRKCEGDPVRLCDVAEFYEAVFGRSPVSQLDTLWLQCILHPRYRERRAQRAFDVIVGGALAAIFLPLLAPLALLIRRDGGPALYRQERIGQDGRPFAVHKLRTMRWTAMEPSQRWSREHDARVTRVGHVLRRTHLDELPQLLAVLRGDMTLVGPRPEQPEIAAGLEALLPFWRARYRYKPGLTGWAQIHCGYAGSQDGSAWKLAHDLYYLRHQSLALDAAILVQTGYTLLFAPQFVESSKSPFVRCSDAPVEHDPEAAIASVPSTAA
jgi:exopolysaccharide biosynthesis polyprenyl glycosylphosphotransferase